MGRGLTVAALIGAVTTLGTVLPVARAEAVLVRTETALESERAQTLRDSWLADLRRAEVQRALEAQGVHEREAEARLRSLTDREVLQIARHLDELPAGQGLTGVVIAVLVVFALLVILDATGVTDVFPGIDPKP